MNNATKIIILLIVVTITGFCVFLANWKIPAPTSNIEKVVPDERFPQ